MPIKACSYIEQTRQEEEYSFPYHYIAQFEGDRFKPFFFDSWAINYASTIEFLLQRISLTEKNRIVDVGCGDGRFSRELSLAFKGSTVVGMDYSSRAIDLATAINSHNHNLFFQSIDITQKHNICSFDAAVLMEVLEHIPITECEVFIKSAHQLLKKGGVLFLTVPHENKPLEYKHFQHFNVESLSSYLLPYFHIVDVVPFEKISWLRGMVLSVLCNRFFILNNPHLLFLVYRFYKKYLFFCKSEKECQRIFVKAVAR